jgi:hypothetical protein
MSKPDLRAQKLFRMAVVRAHDRLQNPDPQNGGTGPTAQQAAKAVAKQYGLTQKQTRELIDEMGAR